MLNNKNVHSNLKVTICVPTYNHRHYIAQCLDSILMQKTNFDLELLIGEDDSTDGTRDICRKYAEQYPDRIRLFLNDRKNVIYIDGRATGRWNFINLLKNAKGKYVALCEGDDYWTSPDKLQKQVDLLENHPECTISFHNCEEIYDDRSKVPWLYCPPDQKAVSTIEDLLVRNFIPTCSAVFRNGLFDKLPDWYYSCPVGDWPLHILNAQYGDICYINEVMAKHRYHAGGVWSLRKQSQNILDVVEACNTINAHFNYKFDSIIKDIISSHHYNLFLIYAKEGDTIRALKYLASSFKLAPMAKKLSTRYLLSIAQLLVSIFYPRAF
jgi:glycosyltransferase involved in cell wall biosynthesis